MARVSYNSLLYIDVQSLNGDETKRSRGHVNAQKLSNEPKEVLNPRAANSEDRKSIQAYFTADAQQSLPVIQYHGAC